MEYTLSLYWVKGACILHCPDGFSFDTKQLWTFFKGLHRRKANVPVNNGLIDSTSAISSLRVGQLQGARNLFINFDTCSSSTAEKRDKLFLVRSFIDASTRHTSEGLGVSHWKKLSSQQCQLERNQYPSTQRWTFDWSWTIWMNFHITNLNKFRSSALHIDSKPIMPSQTLIANLQPTSTV